ncbi:MAG: DUF2892 domain-containing protein [candidate division FCPU426 bacterium]
MTKNLGVLDKGARFFVCTLCGLIGMTREPRSGLNGLLILVAIYLLITALSGYDPLYAAFRWNTRAKD